MPLNNNPPSNQCCVCLLKASGRNMHRCYEGEHGKSTELPWKHLLYQ